MPSFRYRGITKLGRKVHGVMDGKNKHDVIVSLKKSKIWPIEVTEKKEPTTVKQNKKVDYERLNQISTDVKRNKEKREERNGFNPEDQTFWKKLGKSLTSDVSFGIKPKEILTFTNSLYILKKAKFNNITAFESLYNSTENRKLKDSIDDILIGIQEGSSIHGVMEKYPKIFPPLYVNFVKVGEESGSLDTALSHARDYMESNMKLTKQIKSVLIPKVILFAFLMVALIAALLFGTPLIQNVYDMFGVDRELPKATQIAVEVAEWIVEYWYIVLAAIAGIFAVIWTYIHTDKGRYNWDRFKLKAPVIGELLLNITTNKFLKAMLLNLRNGMRIQESLETSKAVTENYYFLSLVEDAKNSLLAGNSWLEPFRAEKALSVMVLEMLEIGMKTDLVEMMDKVEDYLQEEIDETIAKTVKRLPEVSYALIGLVLIAFVITVMVPLIDVYMGGFLFDTIQ